MIDPQYTAGPPETFVCGNDERAKQTVTDFPKAFGRPAMDIGEIVC